MSTIRKVLRLLQQTLAPAPAPKAKSVYCEAGLWSTPDSIHSLNGKDCTVAKARPANTRKIA